MLLAWVLVVEVALVMAGPSPLQPADRSSLSSGDGNGRLIYQSVMNTTAFRPENQYPVYYPSGEGKTVQPLQITGSQPVGRHYKIPDSRDTLEESHKTGDSFRSYNRALYSQPNTYTFRAYPAHAPSGNKKMDMSDMETSTKTITSYDADKNPVYKQQYNQAEPPPYPPLADSESSEISSVQNNKDMGYESYTNSQADLSYLPQPEDYSYYGAPNADFGDVPSYQGAKPGADDMASSMKEEVPKPAMKDVSMGKIPVYPGSHHEGELLLSKPTGDKMPDNGYEYSPYHSGDDEHYLPYNPEIFGNMFGHPLKQNTKSEENNDEDDSDHYHHPVKTKTKPKDSEESSSHEHEDGDDFGYHYLKYHGDEPSAPTGGKMKPSFHMYSSSEDESSDSKPKSKPPPPPPEVYYSGPHKPPPDYGSHHDHDDEQEHHKEPEEDEEEEYPGHEDHNSDYRLNKKPYSYYYLGRKLWYIPLYFSVYFIVYVTALILKSIARHKIKYPITHWSSRSLSGDDGADENHFEDISANVTKALSSGDKLFMR